MIPVLLRKEGDVRALDVLLIGFEQSATELF
jgi:hypothetical protein